MTSHFSDDPQALLAHAPWVKALAHSLIDDPHLAEDLAQDTWLAALQRPPATGENPRGWLGRVLTNFFRQTLRSDRRRQGRERGAARVAVEPSTVDVVSRVATIREVVDAVIQLEEPYRRAISMRFFDQLPPRKIAAKLELPIATVHTHISRGLERLRTVLDRRHGGDRRSWAATLLPMASPRILSAAGIGLFLMNTQLKLVALALLVLGGVSIWSLYGSEADQPVAGKPERPAAEMGAPGDLDSGEAKVARVELPPHQVTEEREAAESSPGGRLSTVEAIVLDTRGLPLVGVSLCDVARGQVIPAPDSVEAASLPLSDDRGRVFLQLVGDASRELLVVDSRYVTVLSGVLTRGSYPREAVVVAGQGVALGGRVVDQDGLPLVGVELTYRLPSSFRGRFRQVMDFSGGISFATTTDTQGQFNLPRLAYVDIASLRIHKPGYDQVMMSIPTTDQRDLLIELAVSGSGPKSISGVVLDMTGVPVADAHVGMSNQATKTNARGEFAFDLSADSPAMAERASIIKRMSAVGFTPSAEMLSPSPVGVITAVKAGHLPGEISAPRDPSTGEVTWPKTLIIRLGGEPLSIGGRVVDADGKPLSEAFIWLVDPTRFGGYRFSPGLVEAALNGSDPTNYRGMAVQSDSDGHFQIGGLLDRNYTLRAMDDESLLRVEVGPIRAGSRDILVAMSADGYFMKIAGQVVSLSGRPQAGISIRPMTDTISIGGNTSHATTAGTVTDAEGLFELERIPRQAVYLRLDGNDILPVEYGRNVEGGILELSGGAIDRMQIPVPLRCHLRIDPGVNWSDDDQIEIIDGEGETLTINVFIGNGRRSQSKMSIAEIAGVTLGVSEAARAIVILRGDKEVRRVPVSLSPDGVNEVSL